MNYTSVPEINPVVNRIRQIEYPLLASSDLDPLIELIGDSKFVLLGDANYGTHESYQWRMQITKRLIAEKNFSFIAVAGDWRQCKRINHFINNQSALTADQLLMTFDQWPSWIWANWETAAFIDWLREYNQPKDNDRKIGFYGLDIYNHWETFRVIENFFRKRSGIDSHQSPHKANTHLQHYESINSYLHPVAPSESSKWITSILAHLHRCTINSGMDEVLSFCIRQNEIGYEKDEQYLSSMITNGPDAWNNRDRMMVKILNSLTKLYGPESRVIIWDHNMHIGDVRATETKFKGVVNIGQLLTEHHKNAGAVRVGFGSYKGSILAGKKWNDVTTTLPLHPATAESWEGLLHAAGGYPKLILSKSMVHDQLFLQPIDHRAIGIFYDPEIDDMKNYVLSVIPKCYDAFIFLDEISPLRPVSACRNGENGLR